MSTRRCVPPPTHIRGTYLWWHSRLAVDEQAVEVVEDFAVRLQSREQPGLTHELGGEVGGAPHLPRCFHD